MMKTANTTCRFLADMRALLMGFVTYWLLPCSGALAADGTWDNLNVTTSNYSAPAEYCVMGQETSADAGKWTLRHILEIPTGHHFLVGDIFVSFSHPDFPGAIWFSSGETFYALGFKPASWHSYAEQGPVAYYSGMLNPLIPVNVVSRPLDLSSLEGGRITISYGLRENANATVADSYREMLGSEQRNRISTPLVTASAADVRGAYTRYCFIVTGVRMEDYSDNFADIVIGPVSASLQEGTNNER